MKQSERFPRWMVIWLSISMLIVLWDVSFVLLRPMSMPGGSLSSFWGPYAKYITVDKSYADLGNPFVAGQAIMSLGEIFVGVAGLVLHFRKTRLPLANLLVFCMSTMTFAKTALILVMELVSHGRNVGHNPIGDLLSVYLIPNGFWIVVPFLVMLKTGKTLLAPLGAAASTKAAPESDRSAPALAADLN